MTKPNGWESKAKESIAGVVKTTMTFIQGEMTLEQREAVYDSHMDFIHQAILSAEENLLREIMEEIPERATLRGNLNFSPSSFNEALDQVNTLLERKLSTVKK